MKPSPLSDMKWSTVTALSALLGTAAARLPLSYAAVPQGTYELPKNGSVTTITDLLKSRDDCSQLLQYTVVCHNVGTLQ